MLVPLDAEVDLAVSFAQAEIIRADLQQELAGVSGLVSSRIKQLEQTQTDLAAVGVIKGSELIVDVAAIDKSIQESQTAALVSLDSAVGTLWSTALPGRKEEGSAEQAIKDLERASWNWQVWAMLGLAHQARAELQQQMGNDEEAKAEAQTASIYLAKARETRPDLVRLTGPN